VKLEYITTIGEYNKIRQESVELEKAKERLDKELEEAKESLRQVREFYEVKKQKEREIDQSVCEGQA